MRKITCFIHCKNFLYIFILLCLGSTQLYAQCPTITNPNQTFCDIQSPTVAQLQAVNNGNGVRWYISATATTPLASSIGLVNGHTYYVDDNSGACGTRNAVTVTIYTAPTGQNFQGVCVDNPNDATIASLIAQGNNVQWYSVPTGGAPLTPTTILNDNTIYYAGQTNPVTGCQTSRLSVFVNVGVVPVPVGPAVQQFCFNTAPTVANLVPSTNVNWYSTGTSALPLELNTLLVNGQSYFATAVDPPCESDQRLEVIVSLVEEGDPGDNGALELCENAVLGSIVNLFESLGGTPETTGIWSGPVTTTNNHLGTLDASGLTLAGSPYVFTYTIDQGLCDPQTATVTVTLLPEPNAGDNGTLTLCSNDSAVDLFNSLGGTPQPGGTWSPALSSGSGIFNPQLDPAGVYTYTVSGTAPCGAATATVSVTLEPAAEPGDNGSKTFCSNEPGADLFASLGGTPEPGGTWSPALNSGSGFFDPQIDPAGVYTYTVGGTTLCDSQTATVTVTVTALPKSGVFTGNISVCALQPTLDLTTLLDGSQDTNGVWTNAVDNQIVAAVIAIAGLPVGAHSYIYTVTNSCGSQSTIVHFSIAPIENIAEDAVTVTSPICLGQTAFIVMTNLTAATYTVVYSLSGVNTAANQTIQVTPVSGTATVEIPGTLLTNAGTTTVTIHSVTNSITTCVTSVTDMVRVFEIQPVPIISAGQIAIDNICVGSDVTVVISNTTLANGDYQISYTLPNAIPASTDVIVTLTDGSGRFTIPAGAILQTGDYTFTVTALQHIGSGCVSSNLTVTTGFTVFPMPTVSSATVTVGNVCLGVDAIVFITATTVIPDDNYTITYQLSSGTTPVTLTAAFINGTAQFIIPATAITTTGSVIITIDAIRIGNTPCGSILVTMAPFEFIVNTIETPQLIELGNTFCSDENATIANLSQHIIQPEQVVWYNAPSGGTAYAATEPLVNGMTYYAALVSDEACESSVRLAVTVVIDNCVRDIEIPDGFSPNDDGINDDFVIKNLPELYPNFYLEIYNRYGNILYKGNKDTPNWNGRAWEGTKFGSGVLPTGVYFFVLEFNDGNRKPIQGRVYLSR